LIRILIRLGIFETVCGSVQIPPEWQYIFAYANKIRLCLSMDLLELVQND